MIGTAILWLVYAFVLRVAMGWAGKVPHAQNTFWRALLTAALLSMAGAAVGLADSGILSLIWPVVWLFILKSLYDIGWGRAILVWLALVAITVGLVMFVLVPLGLLSAGFFALLL